ncbi:hypothetical protein HPB47_012736 [Ixodes persulcatus]|uniref:Uncharacterized protein n=1 Tax=Ixodes persulcatus TaxID=34615 RepID=A0AC60NSU8_IXOPE|nr:hypothetical protein HPB47_012736 [Ixodes persulcatus]
MKRQELAAASSRASTTKVSRTGTDGDSVRTSISENGIVADADGGGGRGDGLWGPLEAVVSFEAGLSAGLEGGSGSPLCPELDVDVETPPLDEVVKGPCVRSVVRRCFPADMVYQFFYSNRGRKCTALGKNTSRCLRNANRFRTFSACNQACRRSTLAPKMTSKSRTKLTLVSGHRIHDAKGCRLRPSLGPCTSGDRRRAEFYFDASSQVCERRSDGQCADEGYATLKACLWACHIGIEGAIVAT